MPNYGFFVDHVVDLVTDAFMFLGLGISGYMRFDVASLGLIAYLMFDNYILIRTSVTGIFQISFGKFGPTELRAIMIIANTLIYFFGNPTLPLGFVKLTVLDTFGIFAIVILFSIFIYFFFKEANRLAEAETQKGP